MSEKMNRMISSLLGKLDDNKNQRKIMKYKNWCALVEKKSSSLISYLKALECTDTEKKEKISMATNKVLLGLNELITQLGLQEFKHLTSFSSASPALQDQVKQSLLDVWWNLLQSIPKLEKLDVTVVVLVHKAVLQVLCREEFACHSWANGHRELLIRYRRLLQVTLHTSTSRLVERPSGPSSISVTFNVALNSMMNINFACKVLAVVYWRLPYVGTAISQILEIPDIELLAPVLSFSAFPEDNNNNISNNNSMINNNNTSNGSISSLDTSTSSLNQSNNINNNSHNNNNNNRNRADLFGWAQLYKDLPPLTDSIIPPSPSINTSTPTPATTSSPTNNDSSDATSETSNNNNNNINNNNNNNTNNTITISNSTGGSLFVAATSPPPSSWLTIMAKFDVNFFTFFKEWILHVKCVLGKPEWNTVPGFPRLLQSLLYQMRIKEQPPPPLSKPYPLLELQYLLLEQTNSELIDSFVKAVFLRTNVFDLLSVLNTLHLLEGWFNDMQAHNCILPATFDVVFFCSGIDVLLKSDHHQIVLRVISHLYSFTEIFEGTLRAHLFDLLLSKFFYILFMHWDPGVRNAYHQLLIFKMVRIKRSTLYNDGYVVKELSQVGTTTYHSKDSTPENGSALSSANRSGSGFFSSITNALPAFFTISNSPDHDNSNNNNNNDQPSTPRFTDPKVVPPETKSTTSQNSNSSSTNSMSDSSDSLDDSFVEVSPPANNNNTNNDKNNGSISPTLPTSEPSSPSLHPTNLDVQLFLKLNSHLKTIEDQLRKPTAKKAFEARLEAYAPLALAEFNQHLARYHQWELKNEDPPRLMPLPFARMGEG